MKELRAQLTRYSICCASMRNGVWFPEPMYKCAKTAADSYNAHSEGMETEGPLLLTHIAESVSVTFSERPFHGNQGPEKMRKIVYENITQVSVLYVFAHTSECTYTKLSWHFPTNPYSLMLVSNCSGTRLVCIQWVKDSFQQMSLRQLDIHTHQRRRYPRMYTQDPWFDAHTTKKTKRKRTKTHLSFTTYINDLTPCT